MVEEKRNIQGQGRTDENVAKESHEKPNMVGQKGGEQAGMGGNVQGGQQGREQRPAQGGMGGGQQNRPEQGREGGQLNKGKSGQTGTTTESTDEE